MGGVIYRMLRRKRNENARERGRESLCLSISGSTGWAAVEEGALDSTSS
jgi:hypothetical protein